MEWIERLGGWAVVLVIVRWMMQRIDQGQKDAREDRALFREALDAFKSYQASEDRVHADINASLERVEGKVDALAVRHR
jgi:hypothetical protein